MKPIRHREQFFRCIEEGLQQYFDACDRQWGGILHLTIGVRHGEVGGIIKSADALRYEGYTRQRIEQILRFVLPRYVKRSDVDYVVNDVINELLGMASLPALSQGEGAAESTEVEVQAVVVEPLPKRRRGRKQKPSTDNQH